MDLSDFIGEQKGMAYGMSIKASEDYEKNKDEILKISWKEERINKYLEENKTQINDREKKILEEILKMLGIVKVEKIKNNKILILESIRLINLYRMLDYEQSFQNPKKFRCSSAYLLEKYLVDTRNEFWNILPKI